MNNYYLHLTKSGAGIIREPDRGFTLIELLAVVLIMGIMAGLALPILIKQVEKGRQAEARSTLGAINRTQQAYRQEKATFGALNQLPIVMPPTNYYNFSDDTAAYAAANPLGSAQRAQSVSVYDNDIRNYASAVGQTSAGTFTAIICEAFEPTDDSVTTSNLGGVINCVNGRQIR